MHLRVRCSSYIRIILLVKRLNIVVKTYCIVSRCTENTTGNVEKMRIIDIRANGLQVGLRFKKLKYYRLGKPSTGMSVGSGRNVFWSTYFVSQENRFISVFVGFPVVLP